MIEAKEGILATDYALNHLDLINIYFVKINLDLVDFKKRYKVNKIKNTSGLSQILNGMQVVRYATLPILIVMQNETFDKNNINLALYFSTSFEFFRTSPIKNVTKKEKKILVETENSVYELTEE